MIRRSYGMWLQLTVKSADDWSRGDFSLAAPASSSLVVNLIDDKQANIFVVAHNSVFIATKTKERFTITEFPRKYAL